MKVVFALSIIALAALVVFGLRTGGGQPKPVAAAQPAHATPGGLAKATFAGGCFWCMEPPFDKTDGVVSTTSGYTGGHVKNPSYEQVSSGGTGHAESLQVVYDPSKVSYEKLLEVYWHNVDPLTPNAQFCDHGEQYRTAIFFHDEEQKRLAEKTRAEVEKELGRKVVTEIVPAGPFYTAEEYHQDYYQKNPIRYKYYRTSCGRDRRLAEIWGDKSGGH